METARKVLAVLLSLLVVFSAAATTAAASEQAADTQEEDTSFIESSITCYRKPFEPVYIKLSGKAYNLLNPFDAISAMVLAKTEQQKKLIAFTYLEMIFFDILNALAVPAPVANTTFVDADKYQSQNFMQGHESFIDSNPDGVWSLGYNQTSLVPDDLLSGDKDYYLAGYLLQNLPANTVEEVLDDMMVYTTVLDDGSGRGKVAFCTIECIGLSNKDIRDIREMLKDFAKENNIVSINVTSTHVHSEIDTMGIWNPFFLKVANNSLAALTGQLLFKTKSGPDEEFMQTLKERTADSIKKATADMEQGELYFSQKDCRQYFYDKRDPSLYEENLYVLRFDPYKEGEKETLILNMPGHPYITGLKSDKSSGKQLSGDYTAAINSVLTENGYNFMFIIGATLGIYADRGQTNDGVDMSQRYMQAERYGKEMAYIAMSMTKTKEEVIASDYVDIEAIEAEKASVAEGAYTVWFENWEPVAETKVSPILNIAHKEVVINVENPVLLLVGKMGLVNHRILDNGNGTYSTPTEIGYAQIGDNIHIALMPGEISPELIYGGGTLLAENSFSGCDFPASPVCDTLNTGEDDVLLCFGLANDEIGYILNDNDYCLLFFDDVEPFGDHYQESIAFSRTSGSALMNAFAELAESTKK